MNKIRKLIFPFKTSSLLLLMSFAVMLAFLNSCGSKRNPTGGKLDIDKPQILATLPEEYSEINEQKLEITFSKAIDRSTFLKGIYIYPPVLNKKVYFESNVITLKFLEALEKDTNYFITLSTRIKDVRGNALGKNQTLIYKSGKLQDNKISGNVHFEDAKDGTLPIQLTLLSADSLWVLSREITGNAYALESLNPISHILRAFIDKNLNGRYDPNQEPYFEAVTPVQKIYSLDLNMAYADTVKPALKSVKAISNREYELVLNKTIKSFGKLTIKSPDKRESLPVLLSNLQNDRIRVLTAVSDTSKWAFSLTDLIDVKGNITAMSALTINGSATADKIPPSVTSCSPRSGTSVNNLQPILEITFSEVIPVANINANLKESESGESIPYRIIKADGKTFQFQAEQQLSNYRSCMLTIETTTADISGNQLKEPFKLVFLPIFRNGK